MLPLLLALLGLLLLLSLALGSASIPLEQIVTVLLGGEADQAAWTNIVLKFRLPKTATAALAGMSLGVSGLLMQTYFRNPLAEPFVLGVSSGASLGVALVVLGSGAVGGALLAGLGLAGDLLLTVAAGAGAALSMILVLLASLRIRSGVTLLLLGLMFGYLVGALVSLLLYFALPERIQAYVNWTFGSFSGVTAAQLPILAFFTLGGLLLSASLVKPLNALLLGEEYARSLGIHLKAPRCAIILATALLVSAVTAFCGPIAFLGIAVPHLSRRLAGQFRSPAAAAGRLLDRRLRRALRRADCRAAGQQSGAATECRDSAARRAGGDAGGAAPIARRGMTLQTRDLSIGYRRRGRPDIVLARTLNLRLRPGELVGLMGPNGIGKSTLLRALGGLQPPLAGRVLLGQRDITCIKPQERARRLSMVTTAAPCPRLMKGYALVALGRHPHTDWLGRLTDADHAAIAWALDAIKGAELARQPVAELSDGQRQKLMIARALAQQSDIMLLDEPTAFLDLPRRIEIMALLKQLARATELAILVSTARPGPGAA